MNEIIVDAFFDSLNMVPLLLIIYIGIELIEYKWGHRIKSGIEKAGSTGPLIGAVGGGLPQCGFSVIATALYTEKLTTIGTLIAVYLSTSDEAIPVILSQPTKIPLILPLILTKVSIAIIAGFTIDFVFKKSNQKTIKHIKQYKQGIDSKSHKHEDISDKKACCGHKPSSNKSKNNYKELFVHPAIHTIKIFAFIFSISVILNYIIFTIGEDNFNNILASNTAFQPILAAIIGLIPNCAASVAITELYLNNSITYGATIAGLCASGGLGLLVLLKEDKNKKEVALIIGLLLGVSIIAGSIIQFLKISI